MQNLRQKPLIFRRILFLALDVISICIAYYAGTYATLHTAQRFMLWQGISLYLFTAILITLPALHLLHAYTSLWEYAESRETISIFSAISISVLLSLIVHKLMQLPVDFSAYIVAWAIQILLICSTRILYRIIRRFLHQKHKGAAKRVLVVGAGSAGILAIRAMQDASHMEYIPVAIVDDSPEKVHCYTQGLRVIGTRYDIPAIVENYNIDVILLAIPSASDREKSKITEIALSTGAKIKTLPPLHDILFTEMSPAAFTDIDVTTFLNRDEITLDTTLIDNFLRDKVILVTGGGGSIGQELCRQIANYKPSNLLIFDILEHGAYTLQNELSRTHPFLRTEIIIGSVQDITRLDTVLAKYKPQIIFHAAAHKHVPICESCPGEAVKNNVFGTLNLANCADKHQVAHFVMISTDKAVNPTNVMGATKRAAELIIQHKSKHSETRFSLVRFGNVLGSSGSVIPRFQKQIRLGGPVTVTHKDITRFFMTIPEAAQLVIEAGAMAQGGEIFILDMGKPVKIDDLARQMIRLAGFQPDKDIKIQYTGLRPGEKLYEELLLEEEGISATKHQKLYTVPPMEVATDFPVKLEELRRYLDTDDVALVASLEKLIGKSLRPHADENTSL